MPDARYFIVRRNDAWMVRIGEQEFGPYRSQSAAVFSAIDAAERVNAQGDNAELVLSGSAFPTRMKLEPGREPRVLVNMAG